jgi:hypothetical protein
MDAAAAASAPLVPTDADVFECCKVICPVKPSARDASEVRTLLASHMAKASACTSAVFAACRETGGSFRQTLRS